MTDEDPVGRNTDKNAAIIVMELLRRGHNIRELSAMTFGDVLTVLGSKLADPLREVAKHPAGEVFESITCPECSAVSYSAQDVENGYCGRCHRFTGGRA